MSVSAAFAGGVAKTRSEIATAAESDISFLAMATCVLALVVILTPPSLIILTVRREYLAPAKRQLEFQLALGVHHRALRVVDDGRSSETLDVGAERAVVSAGEKDRGQRRFRERAR